MRPFSSMLLLCLSIIPFNALANTLSVNQTIRDGQTIVSPQQSFELGFFSPGNASQNRYLGIWFKRLATGTIVWVANRETPINSTSGELTLNLDGVLVLRDSTTNRVVWSSDTYGKVKIRNPMGQLFDNGNFMITDGNETEDYIWQSFDYPGDIELPGMKLGRNKKGIVMNYTSWKSVDDPSPGTFMFYLDFNGLPQSFLKNGDQILSRLGSWNGLAYTGRPSVRFRSVYTLEYISNEKETYATYKLVDNALVLKLILAPDGSVGRFKWDDQKNEWFLISSPISDSCERFSLCGPYGSCQIQQSPPCDCLKGFAPKSLDQWDLGDWTNGCERVIPLDCGYKEGFRKYSFMKLPDTRQSWYDKNMSVQQCESKCKRECNCTAYATLDIKHGTGCLIWYHELIDMRSFPDDGQDIYIRMAAAELDKDKRISKIKKVRVRLVVIIAALLSAILLGILFLVICKRRQTRKVNDGNMLELPLFSLSTLLRATDNFSDKNKIGEGGFGPVYKGLLEDGRVVAVKRLSNYSTQGVEEFKNEVIFISKLQHRNLVKILGCCIHQEEKILIYEYMPNKSLDLFIYEETQIKKLDWALRYQIVNGIARGLLYLHEDSCLRIIHRDLKAANILLDLDMNPKISDFGIAKCFIEDEIQTNTKKVVGTYGYMSPEYARDGIISVKSDIFSFGVIVLEIVTGMKNRGFSHEAHSHNLLGHASWLYKEGKMLELVDASFVNPNHISEVLLSIQVGLLCVQHNPKDRPTMSEVVMMLSGEGGLTEPKHPGFYTGDVPRSSIIMEPECTNNITLTIVDGR